MSELNTFSNSSRLKPSKIKYEFPGTGALYEFQLALVAWNVLISITKPWKCFGFICPINKILSKIKIFANILSKQKTFLKLCCMRQLTLEGRIKMFKSLAVSKVIHLLVIIKLYNNTIDLLYKIQENLFWQEKKVKFKHSTLCNGYEKETLKTLT